MSGKASMSMKIGGGRRLQAGGGGGGMSMSRSTGSLLGTMNVARLVSTAFKSGANAVAPKMLGLKAVKAKGISASMSDLEESTHSRSEC